MIANNIWKIWFSKFNRTMRDLRREQEAAEKNKKSNPQYYQLTPLPEWKTN
jgi:hypothetical protein